jgi:hypothetical protein
MSISPKDLLTPPETLSIETIAGLLVTDPAPEDYINMLIYGDPGVEKTRLAGSSCMVPEMSPVLLLDFEGGTLSLSRDYRDVRVIRVKSWEKLAEVYNWLYDKNPFKTIVLDSLTETYKFSMQGIMQDVVRKDAARDQDVPSLREWGKAGEQIRRLVRALRDLPCNTIFTALAREERDEHAGINKTRPSLPGQLRGEIPGYVDIVGYLYKKEFRAGGEREMKTLLLLQGTERQVAKDRSGQLPPIMEQPTMTKIYERIYGQ